MYSNLYSFQGCQPPLTVGHTSPHPSPGSYQRPHHPPPPRLRGPGGGRTIPPPSLSFARKWSTPSPPFFWRGTSGNPSFLPWFPRAWPQAWGLRARLEARGYAEGVDPACPSYFSMYHLGSRSTKLGSMIYNALLFYIGGDRPKILLFLRQSRLTLAPFI